MSATRIFERVKGLITDCLPAVQSMRYEVNWKEDGSPVTRADLLLEDRISALLRSELPNVQIIGEETWINGEVDAEGWFAVLDPIDGTENFCSGLREWGTCLSIWRANEHFASFIGLPELGEYAWTGNITRVPRSRIVGYSSSYHLDIARGIADNRESRISGCAAYNLYNVARGSFSRFVNPKGAYSWDLLAGISLAKETGCEIYIDGKQYGNEFLEPNRKYCVDIQHRYDIHTR